MKATRQYITVLLVLTIVRLTSVQALSAAAFSDANWIDMGLNFGGSEDDVRAAVIDGSGNLYIGGDFVIEGEAGIIKNIAKWNGSSWTALGSGIGGSSVYALAVSGSDLYAGGAFTNAGGSAANHIAKWNGSSWSALGSGMNASVWALAVSGTDLYAAGRFTNAGGVSANHIAKWNGSSWSALGSGMNDPVYASVHALAVSGSDLYAGGSFTTAGGNAANSIAKWNGSSWSALGSEMSGGVIALAVSGTDLYAAGGFVLTTADGTPAWNIAKWNGTNWSALGSGLISGFSPAVITLAVSGGDVYAGGLFTSAGGSAANRIAKWDGSSWSALGSGINAFTFTPSVYALAVSGNDLYVAGSFGTAGGKFSRNVARAYLDLPALSALRSGTNVTLSWPASFRRFALQENPNAANTNSWSNANYLLITNAAIKSTLVPLKPTNQFFRLIGN